MNTGRSRIICFLLLICTPLISRATVTIAVDREPVELDGAFHVVIEADGSIPGTPDFSPLEQVLEILGTSRSSQVNIINGDYSATTRWTLQVMARRSGELTLPPIQIGQEATPALKISVVEASGAQGAGAGNDIFVEVDAEPRNPYVQAQVLYTIRLYRAVNTRNGSLSEPRAIGGQVVVKRLGEDKSFETVRKGRRYQVVERRFALFPQQSGQITLAPEVFDGELGGAPRPLFDPFGRGSRLVRHRSPALSLQVRPIPAGFSGKTWLPARQLELHEAWSTTPPRFKVGEPITRTLAVIADGLAASQLPELPVEPRAALKSYPDTPELRDEPGGSGVVGVRQERITLIPTREGDSSLPPVDLVWWNTEADREEHARLAPRPVHVAPGRPSPARRGAEDAPPPPAAPPKGLPLPLAPTPGDRPGSPGVSGWMLSSLALAGAWIATLLLWWRSHRGVRDATADAGKAESLRGARRALRQACERDDPRAARAALLDWARLQWPQAPPNNLSALGERTDPGLRAQIACLNRSLYAPGSAPWRGHPLWDAFEATRRGLRAAGSAQPVPDLAPLYSDPG